MSAPPPLPGANLPPASGVSSSGWAVNITIIVFLVIATIAVVLRISSRQLKGLRPSVDDWLIVAALLVFYGGQVTVFIGTIKCGLGFHIGQLSPSQLELLYKVLFAGEILYVTTITLSRVSINVLFLNIFNVRRYRLAAYANIAFNISWFIYGLFVQVFRCHPIAEVYDITIKNGQCLNFENVELSIPIWGLVCDAFTWILPLPWVWRLHASKAQRIGLTLIFSIGLIAIAMGITRAITIADASYTDMTYGFTTATIVTSAEPASLILCACGPLFRPVWESLRHSSIMERLYSVSPFSSQHSRKRYNDMSKSDLELQDSNPTQHGSSTAGSSVGKPQVSSNNVIVRSDISVTGERLSDEQYLGRMGKAV